MEKEDTVILSEEQIAAVQAEARLQGMIRSPRKEETATLAAIYPEEAAALLRDYVDPVG